MAGLFSGKYDSTKQNTVLLQGSKLENYLSYNVTLRMEILLTGEVVLTDAQFIDGMYFHWIAQHGTEFEAFQKLINKFIVIKSRANNFNEIIIPMFCGKEFYTSAVKSKELADRLLKLSAQYKLPQKGCKGEPIRSKITEREMKNLCDYIDETEGNLKQYKTNFIYMSEWKRYSAVLNKFNIDNLYTKREGDFKFSDICKELLYSEIDKTYSDAMDEILDKIDEKNDDISILNDIKCLKELDKIVRSSVMKYLDNIVYKGQFYEDVKKYRQLYNDRYNKTIALQHKCAFIDICDYVKPLEIAKFKEENCLLPRELVDKLGIMSWEEFSVILESTSKQREKWNQIYGSHYQMNSQKVIDELNRYLDTIKQHILDMDCKIGTSKFKEGPWNWNMTCDDSSFKDVHCYFIAGGSYEKKEKGNEICILCPSENDASTVIRLRIDDSGSIKEDDKYDTMIAPVRNYLNGN